MGFAPRNPDWRAPELCRCPPHPLRCIPTRSNNDLADLLVSLDFRGRVPAAAVWPRARSTTSRVRRRAPSAACGSDCAQRCSSAHRVSLGGVSRGRVLLARGRQRAHAHGAELQRLAFAAVVRHMSRLRAWCGGLGEGPSRFRNLRKLLLAWLDESARDGQPRCDSLTDRSALVRSSLRSACCRQGQRCVLTSLMIRAPRARRARGSGPIEHRGFLGLTSRSRGGWSRRSRARSRARSRLPPS